MGTPASVATLLTPQQQRVMSQGACGTYPRTAHHRPATFRDRAWRSQIAGHEQLKASHNFNTSRSGRLRCASQDEGEPEETHVTVSESQKDLWHVPWDGWHTTTVMIQLWAVTVPLGVSGVAIVGTLAGYTAETMGGPERYRLWRH